MTSGKNQVSGGMDDTKNTKLQEGAGHEKPGQGSSWVSGATDSKGAARDLGAGAMQGSSSRAENDGGSAHRGDRSCHGDERALL